MAPGIAGGKRKFKRWGEKEEGSSPGEKKAFLGLHSLVTRMLSWKWQRAPGVTDDEMYPSFSIKPLL